MSAERTQKQLLLAAGVISSVGGLVSAAGGVIGNFTDFFGKIGALSKLPTWAFWLFSCFLLLLGLWLLVKWRTRYSRLLRPDALRLDRNNSEHLVGRETDIDSLLQQCLLRSIVFLEGESGSGKSALVRSGLLPRLKAEKSILPLMLADLWVDHWERGPFNALRIALTDSEAFAEGNSASKSLKLSDLADLEKALAKLSEERARTALIVFDQFDDYQARNRERFLPNKIWLSPNALRRENPFWDMIGRLLEQDKIRALFVTRSDTAAGLNSVQFLGVVEALRLDRVASPFISELLTRLADGNSVIEDPEAGWNKLKERIVRDISQQDVVLPQQLKIMLGGIQSLKRLNIAYYERAGGASGIEALYVEQQITGTSRKVGIEVSQVRAILIALIDPENQTKTRSLSKADLATILQKVQDDRLDKALQELERGEILRSATDPQTGLIAYRLDHDYLARGVLAAERRANRWYYLLADGAVAFHNSSSVLSQWKSLLPMSAQCRLAWERLWGGFRYGLQSNYALLSLLRFVPLIVLASGVLFGSLVFANWRERQAATESARKILLQLEFRNGVGSRELDAAWSLASTRDANVRTEFVDQLLGTREYAEHFMLQPDLVAQATLAANPFVRERIVGIVAAPLAADHYDQKSIAAVALALHLQKMEIVGPVQLIDAIGATKDVAQLRVLGSALAMRMVLLKPGDLYANVNRMIDAIKSTKVAGQANELTRAVTIAAKQLGPEDAYAVARPVVEVIKAGAPTSQQEQMVKILAALAPQLRPDDGSAIASVVLDASRANKERKGLVQALAAVSARLKPEDMTALMRAIGEEIVSAKDVNELRGIEDRITAVAVELKSDDAYRLATLIAERSGRANDEEESRSLTRALVLLTPRLKPDNISSLVNTAVGIVKKTKDQGRRLRLLKSFINLVAPLKPEDKTFFTGPLVEALKKNPGVFSTFASPVFFTLDGPQDVLNNVAFASQLGPRDANVLARWAIDLLAVPGNSLNPETIFPMLLAIAPRVGNQEAFALANQLLDFLKTSDLSRLRFNPFPFALPRDRVVRFAAPIFVALSPRLKQEDAYTLARELAGTTKDDQTFVPIFAPVAAQLSPETLRLVLGNIVESVKRAKTSSQLSALAPAMVVVASQMPVEDIPSCVDLTSQALGELPGDQGGEAAKALVALARRLPWPERLSLLASVLKYPTSYGSSRDVLINAVKEHPEAKQIQSSQFWEVMDWIKSRKFLDLTSPPQRAKIVAG
ncbi:hypothetical protein ACVIW2_006983 [Bradyrhizobium huanghuaihaiense]|uniref:Novel STAND NTPase 1 domain-containing protein n=1 Tax=Bradyrhizobium huanghuaihaiense TaxID=990078 RepID=A0A562RD52_9BRAD|nr:hypothetical protein [Bradyrhizobium huanghuaihaiense]TWI67001.1 hypothetical protein IQ16_04631 [Bradyrhizobium huanghuaihaiense]